MKAAAFQLAVLMVVFTIVECGWPASRAHKWWRRPLLVDLCAWLIHPLSISVGITLASEFTNTLFAAHPNEGFWFSLLIFRGHVAALSSIVQITMAVVAADFLSYWIHRAYHRFPLLWTFHVVHHTSEELDWLSTSRLHPVSQIANTVAVGVVLLAAGLSITAVIAANIFIGAAALLAHANVNWTFGPLRHLVVSPLFHQWHHARIDDGDHRHGVGNFGAVFSVWDRLFGTWSLSASRRPARFGVEGAPAATIAGLILHPMHVCIRFLSGVCQRRRADSLVTSVKQTDSP